MVDELSCPQEVTRHLCSSLSVMFHLHNFDRALGRCPNCLEGSLSVHLHQRPVHALTVTEKVMSSAPQLFLVSAAFFSFHLMRLSEMSCNQSDHHQDIFIHPFGGLFVSGMPPKAPPFCPGTH